MPGQQDHIMMQYGLILLDSILFKIVKNFKDLGK